MRIASIKHCISLGTTLGALFFPGINFPCKKLSSVTRILFNHVIKNIFTNPDGSIKLAQAESYELSEDNLQITFSDQLQELDKKIRENLRNLEIFLEGLKKDQKIEPKTADTILSSIQEFTSKDLQNLSEEEVKVNEQMVFLKIFRQKLT